MIKQLKTSTTVDELCKNLPPAFANFLKYCRHKLEFDHKPDYGYCREMFKNLLLKRGEVVDNYFDWILKKQGKPIPENDFYDYIDIEDLPKAKTEPRFKKSSTMLSNQTGNSKVTSKRG